jgi:hypothetical protein
VGWLWEGGLVYKKNSNFPYHFLNVLTSEFRCAMLELEKAEAQNGLAAFSRFGKGTWMYGAGVQLALGGSSPPPSAVDVAGHPPLWLWGRASVVLTTHRGSLR